MIRSEPHGEVMLVVADNPPVNALSQELRHALGDALDRAEADPAVGAIVICCDGRGFFAGADIGALGKSSTPPSLPQLIEKIEGSQKPVIAAIHGNALGGGLEVALGCHYRIATRSAKLGLSEVKLGLLPGAGGTQRLPRLVGVEKALSMIVTGEPVTATDALGMDLIDRLVDDDSLVREAILFARERISARDHPRSSLRTDRLADAVRDPAMFDRFRHEIAGKTRGFAAPEACIKAIEAAVKLPFADGMARERALFASLVKSDQSRAQRHVFFAERTAAKVDDIPPGVPRIPIAGVGIVGTGTMGGGIAMNFLSIGIPVTIVEREQAALDRGLATIRRNYERAASRGRLSGEEVDKAMSLLASSLAIEALADCDLIIEAVFESMAVKQEVFRKLDAVAKPGAILASNTSRLDLNEIAAQTGRPEAVIGLHFFSPANVMRLLEVVRSAKTGASQLATAMDLAKRIGKVAVVSGVCPGFIGNRMLGQRSRQAQLLILEGAKPWDVDRVLTNFGFPMGPFQMSDLAGLDLGWRRESSKGESIRDLLCERDRRGQKTSKGYYDYDSNRMATPSAEVESIIAEFAASRRYRPRQISEQEILERLLYPMINEGAKILEEGIAQRASDIDVVWVNGYGWPAFTGGPMFWADGINLQTIVAGLQSHQARFGAEFAVSQLLQRKASNAGRFN
ncbi:3-hydroxyacyl-CoA dehydrogenase NAD-binding domain-containing protein [Bradyrhizobium sp. Gha]|uniref:3-hydroxyacyl-CoA dehydrogenase NAD-binding domain-containing protein n=1 Tax=Bradyrhizobium sp. Gha TaxID=1855318 RepID=UPI0008F00636|nr:3-hydroxyacyl-CoA dehydrogenase NAD-binding domain-containing protein [Bradyrhizobium sp. Gha]SFH65997.1 3-hydroxyacyl-CoA dehydrogenase [Bradyrhizobium sp. Gha]